MDFLLTQIKPPLYSLMVNLKLKSYLICADENSFNSNIQQLNSIYDNLKNMIAHKQIGIDSYFKLLYVFSLLGYYSLLQENNRQVLFYIDKLDKILKNIEKNVSSFPNDIINKCAYYDFFKNILQTLCSNKLSLDKSNFNYSKESMLVLRESCFSKNLLTQKRDNFDVFSNTRTNEIEEENKTQLSIFFLYRNLEKISRRRNSIRENETIKQHPKGLVDYCHSIFNNGSIISKVIIQYDFIKEIINRIHYIYIYSFYYEKDYPAVIDECVNFFTLCTSFYNLRHIQKRFLRLKN